MPISVQPSPISCISPPSHGVLKRFAFEKWAWVVLAAILSSATSSFGSVLGRPFQARECPLIGDSNPQAATAMCINEIGQYTLNAGDIYEYSVNPKECINFEGKPMLCPNHLVDSYIHYKTIFLTALKTLQSLFQEYDSFMPPSYVWEGDFHNYISIDKAGDHAPKIITLNHTLNLNNGALYKAGKDSYNQISACESISKAAQKVIQEWHKNRKIELTDCDVSAGREKTYQTHVFHIDQILRGLVNIPAEESPMIEGSIWLTKAGERVKLHKVSEEDGKIIVVDLKNGEQEKIPLEELIRPEIYTSLTTQIVPGLAVDFPGNNRAFSILETEFRSQIEAQQRFEKIYPAIDKLKLILSLLKNTSVAMPKGPYLIPVSKLMHGFAVGNQTKPKRDKEVSKKIERWLLSINYKFL